MERKITTGTSDDIHKSRNKNGNESCNPKTAGGCDGAARIVQYIVIRGDLIKTLQWPVGAVLAQACHACTAVVHLFYQDENTRMYLSDLDNMHKVVLEAPDESSLKELQENLEENNIDHKLWIEQPENIPTCLVSKPYPKEQVQKYFKKFKLLKN